MGVAGRPPGEMDTDLSDVRDLFGGDGDGGEDGSRSAMRSRASLNQSSAPRPSADDFPVLHLDDEALGVALRRCAAGV